MAGARRSEPGGIQALVGLIDEHPAAFAYDWRARFGMSLRTVLDEDPDWRETLLLSVVLAGDPSSQVSAALAGWDRAWTAEAWILADLFDLTRAANSTRRPDGHYPRPNDKKPDRMGRATLPQHQIRAALAARGHGTGGEHGN